LAPRNPEKQLTPSAAMRYSNCATTAVSPAAAELSRLVSASGCVNLYSQFHTSTLWSENRFANQLLGRCLLTRSFPQVFAVRKTKIPLSHNCSQTIVITTNLRSHHTPSQSPTNQQSQSRRRLFPQFQHNFRLQSQHSSYQPLPAFPSVHRISVPHWLVFDKSHCPRHHPIPSSRPKKAPIRHYHHHY
jgi:hypothetical protein